MSGLAAILAVTLRPPPMMGLVVLGIFVAPFSINGSGGWGGLSWPVFAVTAAAFLVMLRFDRAQQLSRWGRRLDEDLPAVPAAGPASAPAEIDSRAAGLPAPAPPAPDRKALRRAAPPRPAPRRRAPRGEGQRANAS